MKSSYPAVSTPEELFEAYKEVVRLRETEDLPDFLELINQFVSGRSVNRTEPSSPTDVIATDREGDIVINTTGTYEYKLVSVSGTLKWDRRSINTSW